MMCLYAQTLSVQNLILWGRLPTLPAFTAKGMPIFKAMGINDDALWPIADHEPAGNAVENLSDSFAVNMSKAHTADPKNFARITLDASWIRYSIRNKNLGDHPINKGRTENEQIKNVLLLTGHR